jgi:peroxiredoxin Q/BCP
MPESGEPKRNIKRRSIGATLLVILIGLCTWGVRVQTKGELLKLGSLASDFTGSVGGGNSVHLSDLVKQSRVVLVFYPADNTSVCTSQLCALRDSMGELGALDCTVLGINPADERKHAQFAQKYKFPFHLVADKGGQIAKQYGCSGIFGMNKRTVYIINKDRTVLFAQRGVPAVSEMLAALKAARD